MGQIQRSGQQVTGEHQRSQPQVVLRENFPFLVGTVAEQPQLAIMSLSKNNKAGTLVVPTRTVSVPTCTIRAPTLTSCVPTCTVQVPTAKSSVPTCNKSIPTSVKMVEASVHSSINKRNIPPPSYKMPRTLLNRPSLLFFLLLFIVSPTFGHNKIVCDCSKAQLRCYINMTRFTACEAPAFDMGETTAITYTVFENKPTVLKFAGYACKQWVLGEKVTTFWTGSTDHQSYRYDHTLSAAECWKMVQTSVCNNNQMTKTGNAWHFSKNPDVTPQF